MHLAVTSACIMEPGSTQKSANRFRRKNGAARLNSALCLGYHLSLQLLPSAFFPDLPPKAARTSIVSRRQWPLRLFQVEAGIQMGGVSELP
jgi:hypothetical protein